MVKDSPSLRLKLKSSQDPKERCKFSPKTYLYIFFDSEWEYDSGESDLELISHPFCGHPKGKVFDFLFQFQDI